MRGDIQAKALELLEPLYEAEFVDDGWPIFLRALMSSIESDMAIAVCLDLQGRPIEFLSEGVFTPAMATAYESHFAAIDPWAGAILSSKLPIGKNVRSNDLVDSREFEKSEYYNDFFRPNHDLFYTCGALIQIDGGLANVGVPRSRSRGAYSCSDVALLDVMAPHISSALRMHQRLRRADEVAIAAETALDRMRDAMLIADSFGRILYANPAACAELKSGLRISSQRGRLAAGKWLPAAELEGSFRATAKASKLATIHSPVSLASRELDPTQRASVTFYPLFPRSTFAEQTPEGPRVLVIVCQARVAPTSSAPLLRMLYGLTLSEARIAVLLSSGSTLEDVSSAMGISVGTARVHLKHVFMKTGTRRQGQLVTLLNHVSPRT